MMGVYGEVPPKQFQTGGEAAAPQALFSLAIASRYGAFLRLDPTPARTPTLRTVLQELYYVIPNE